MTEEELANKMALRQLGVFQEEDDFDPYYRARSPHRPHFNKNDHSAVVNEMARKIAKAAFSSETDFRVSNRLKETGGDMWEGLKRFLGSPGVRKGMIVASVMLFKMGLWFSYRKAHSQNLDIVDL